MLQLFDVVELLKCLLKQKLKPITGRKVVVKTQTIYDNRNPCVERDFLWMDTTLFVNVMMTIESIPRESHSR